MKLQGDVVRRVKNFKYLGSTASSDGSRKEEVRKKIQASWMSWKKVLELCVTESCQQRLKVKCIEVLLDQSCFMEWKL